MTKFIAYADVVNRDEETDLPLWWSNADGWGWAGNATLFTESEAARMSPPVGKKVIAVAVDVQFPIEL